jgi:uncharacterized protein YraI
MKAIAGKTMKISLHLLCLGLLLGVASGALAKPAYVASTVNLRAGPGTSNEIVAKIPGGSLVDADNCTDGWCAVTWQDKSGFAIQSALDLSGRVPQRRVVRRRVYDEGPVYVEEPPVYYEPPPVYVRPYYYPRPWGWRYRW